MRAAIERSGGEITSRNYHAAWLGFRELGAELLFFERGEVESLPPDADLVVIGGIPTVIAALRRLGVPRPEFPSIPGELLEFAGRRVWTATLAELRAHILQGGEPVFIKPQHGRTKLFTGCVVRRFGDLMPTAGHPDTLEVSCSEVVPFASEYRCFVHQRRVVGCKHYSGDFRRSPISVSSSAPSPRSPRHQSAMRWM